MTDLDKLQTELRACLPERAVEALGNIGLPAIAPGDLEQNIARLAHHVAPSYFPFATFDGSPLAVHLFPGRDVAASPVVYVEEGNRTPKFVCGKFSELSIGAWLWTAQYYKDRETTLRASTDVLSSVIEGGRTIPGVLWDILRSAPEYEPTWWGYASDDSTTKAWELADVGHPFVNLGTVDSDNADLALAQLADYTSRHPDPAPEILAALLAAQAAIAKRPTREYVLRILNAEAWLGDSEVFRGTWKETGGGLSAWDIALKTALANPGILEDTQFAPLIGHSDAFTGGDKTGPGLLLEVAERFRGSGNHSEEVRQLRNCAFVSLYAEGMYSATLCSRIAIACDHVEAESLAASCARSYGNVDPWKA